MAHILIHITPHASIAQSTPAAGWELRVCSIASASMAQHVPQQQRDRASVHHVARASLRWRPMDLTHGVMNANTVNGRTLVAAHALAQPTGTKMVVTSS